MLPVSNQEWLDTQEKTRAALALDAQNNVEEIFERCGEISSRIAKSSAVADQVFQKDKEQFIGSVAYTVPFDDARTCRDINGFFVNASDLVVEGQRYIASQAPMKHTHIDFWKMIVHTQSPTIVSLNMPNDLTEYENPKSIEFWQEGFLPLSFDGWKVEFDGEETVATAKDTPYSIAKRTYILERSDGSEKRVVRQFHFINWPDYDGAPDIPLLAKHMDLVDAAHPSPESPITVHCAAGKGRTGCFIAAHAIRKRVLKELSTGKKPSEVTVNIPKILVEMRHARKAIVSKASQLSTIYAGVLRELTPVMLEEQKGSFVTGHYKEMWDLCNAVYSEYPYLYTAEGKDYVYKYYLDSLENVQGAKVISVYDQETKKLVGFATGIPMSDYRAEHYKKPFLESGTELKSLFYIADLVLLPEYRGQGLEQQMCEALEEHARKAGCYKGIAYLLIDEAERTKHLTPQGSKLYKPYFSSFWERRGYSCSDISFVTQFEIVGETDDTPHKMTYWIKHL